MDARYVLSRITFPLLVGGGMAAAAGLHASGVINGWIVFFVPLLVGVITTVLQRLMPYEARWRGTRSDWGVDILHLALSTALVTSLIRVVLYDGAAWLSSTLGVTAWPDTWPLWVQVPVAVLIGDFFSYWSHRACHEVPWAWRIHVVHHSIERMYLLASVRNHPLNVALTYGAQTVPLVLLGADPAVLMYYTVLTALIGILQHSNVELHTGYLSRVFSTPELHRWHHAVEHAAWNSNFAPDLAIWDQVFGTRYHPDGREAHDVGVQGTNIPVNFWNHLGVPIVLERWKR